MATAPAPTFIVSPSRLGELVREARKRIGWSQEEAARRAGVGARFLGELENGKPTVRLDKVLRVLKAVALGFAILPTGPRPAAR
jgi:HTH-type transcriptional regulator/antitoxin HipB